MGSRSQDSAKLAQLATQLTDLASGCVKVVGVLQQVNEDLQSINLILTELNEAVDNLDRRLTELERLNRNQA